jgi:hypothetical protein
MWKAFLMTICGLGVATSITLPAKAVTRPVVVELFTSQGCSSCPPADAVLAELAARPDVLALGFHVDYWDKLGWKDPLSAPGSTARQNDYASQFGKREVYTPEIVVDGARPVVGSRRAEVLQAIDAAHPEAAAPVSFAADERSVTVGAGTGNGTVTLVRFLRSHATAVKAGENAGHSAVDVNAVVQLAKLGNWNGSALTLPIEPPDQDHGLAILVQSADGRILGAGAVQAGID